MKTKIIAHRGASFIAPENTISAFKLAFKQNADGIEGDFRLTSDKCVVCMHDESAKRTTGIDLNIEKSSYEEIRTLDAGIMKNEDFKGEKIPLLTEILSVLPDNIKFYIEIKSGNEIVPYIKEIIDCSSVNIDNIHFISFSMDVIKSVKEAIPYCKAFWLTNLKDTDGNSLTVYEVISILKDIKADGIDCHACEEVAEEFVSILREAGMELHCWTVDDVETAERFMKLGFDSITTNKPDLLLEKLLQK